MTLPKDNAPFFYHKPALQIIREIEKLNHGILYKKSISLKVKARMRPFRKRFEIRITSDMFSEKRKGMNFGSEPRKVHFKGKTHSLILEKLYFGHRSSNLISAATGSFYTDGYSKTKNYRYRLIIPLEKELDFHYNIQQTRFRTDLGYSSWSGLTCTINGEDLYAQVVHDTAKNYFLSIDSSKSQSFKSFSDKAFAVKNGIGYLTGYLAGDKGYFFTYSSAAMQTPSHFYFSLFRDTIQSHYSPVHSNPHSWVPIPKRTKEKLYKSKQIKPVSTIVFASLCQKLYTSEEFSSIIMLILESSVATLLFMPGGYAIALEAISKLIIAEFEKKKLAPVDSKIMEKIINATKEIIDSHHESIDNDTRSLLKFRVDQWNQPTNKAKLKLPFELLNEELNAKDLQILESRNAFLHGRIPDITGTGKTTTTDRKNKDMYYAALRFYTLLNRLILKWVGFDGYIINQNKIHGKKLGIQLKEPYYIKLR